MPPALPLVRSCWWSRAGQSSSGLWTSSSERAANAIFSGCWRAFALVHRLRVGDHPIFHFKLGMLEALVQIFAAAGVCRTYP
jgi:hypothetical protein